MKSDAAGAGEQVADQKHRGERCAHFDDEHHRVLQQRDRIQLREGRSDRPADDLRIEQRAGPHQLLRKKRRRIVLRSSGAVAVAL